MFSEQQHEPVYLCDNVYILLVYAVEGERFEPLCQPWWWFIEGREDSKNADEGVTQGLFFRVIEQLVKW